LAQSLFSKYLGKLQVEVDDEILELDVKLKDKQRIMNTMGKMKEGFTDEILDKLTETFKEILKRSYPDSTDEELEAFLTKKYESFMAGLSIAFGWTTKEELKKRIEEKEGEVKKKTLNEE